VIQLLVNYGILAANCVRLNGEMTKLNTLQLKRHMFSLLNNFEKTQTYFSGSFPLLCVLKSFIKTWASAGSILL